MPLDSKHTETSFSPNSADSLHLQLTQVPRSPDLVIFLYNNGTDYFTPCACTQDTNSMCEIVPLYNKYVNLKNEVDDSCKS